MEIMTRKQALEAGVKFYFTGKPCHRGHLSARSVKSKRCLICHRNRMRLFRELNPHYTKRFYEAARQRHLANIDKDREYLRNWRKKKLKEDPQFKMAYILRMRLRDSLRIKKTGSPVRDLGCTLKDLKDHLENLFVEGMTWENHGSVWHIDHIQPLSSFDLFDREQFLKAVHYTNLQPLFVKDNLSKGGVRRKK